MVAPLWAWVVAVLVVAGVQLVCCGGWMMTQAEVKREVRAVGMVAVWDRVWLEWRVNYAPGDPRRTADSSYHTTDRADAVATAQAMARGKL